MTLEDLRFELKTWITSAILDFCEGQENTLQNEANERAWGEPLVGFSRGDDPIYEEFKEHIGSYHWTPRDIFTKTFPDVEVGAGELTVICWALPQTGETKADNRKEAVYPAERWARSRVYGEAFNHKLREHLVEVLGAKGYLSVAPMLSPQWEEVGSERFVYSSTWSERHAVFASGLGTFGLCDGLITSKGKAVRLGSTVAHVRISPSPRPYADHRAYCLFFSEETCGECIARCPVGAITEAGHDKKKCNQHLLRTEAYVRKSFGFEGYGCGLCQTSVPCESEVPEDRNLNASRMSSDAEGK